MQVGGLPDIDADACMRCVQRGVSNGFLFLGCSAACLHVSRFIRKAWSVYVMLLFFSLSLSLFVDNKKNLKIHPCGVSHLSNGVSYLE